MILQLICSILLQSPNLEVISKMSGEVKENKMGVMPVNKLLLSMAVPMMISMLVQAMYNIVDSIFVAKLSEEALTAVSLAFPLQSLMISVCTGLCVGMNALLSRYLGAKDSEGVNKSALNGLLLIFIGYLIFLFVGLFLIPTFMYAQTPIHFTQCVHRLLVLL